jgi:3-polyprenyl-4-hydroxybenzoate decarboxylase
MFKISTLSSTRSTRIASWRAITEPVSPDLEICAVTDRVSKSPAAAPRCCSRSRRLRHAGRDQPVRLDEADVHGARRESLDDLAREIEELTNPKMPTGMLDTLKMLPMLTRLKDLMPKTVSSGPARKS